MQKDGGSCVPVTADATVCGISSFFVNTCCSSYKSCKL